MSEMIKEALLRKNYIVQAVQNTPEILLKNKHKGCVPAIKFLMQVRHELQKDSTYSITNPNQLFKKYYLADDTTTEHFQALFELLKQTGFTKIDVLSATMDFRVAESDANVSRGDTMKKYLALVNQAADIVYDNQ